MGAPWFKVYSKQVLSDSKLLCLTDDQFGKLMKLWCFANEDGHIPANPDELRKLLRVSIKEMKKHMEWVLRFFVPDPENPGTLISLRLRAEQDAYASKCQTLRQNGSKGGRPKQPFGLKEENQEETKRFPDPKPTTKHLGGEAEAEREKEKELHSSLRSECRQASRPTQGGLPAAGPAMPVWVLEDLQKLGIIGKAAEGLCATLRNRLPAALARLATLKGVEKPAGLLLSRGDELAQEGSVMLQEQVDRFKALAPKEALSGAQWRALPECLREDSEVQARWLDWMAAKARLDGASEHVRFEAIGEHSAAQRLALEILEARHPERDRIRAEVLAALPSSRSETARRGALMQALGLVPGVPADLQVMPLAVGMTK